MSDLKLVELVGNTALSVLLAVTPLAAVFLAFQVLFLKLPAKEVSRILRGTLLAAAGLFLFLIGVSIAFLPFGRWIGEALAGMQQTAVVVAFGAILGFVTCWGEPSVRVLADEVESASSGSIRRSMVLTTISVGVAAAVALGMLRIRYGIPLSYIVVPGYGIVLALLAFCDKSFVGIAADAGGVATGPLANSFLLALALGASSAQSGNNPLVDGLGLVAIISLAPVMSLTLVGVLYRRRVRPRRP